MDWLCCGVYSILRSAVSINSTIMIIDRASYDYTGLVDREADIMSSPVNFSSLYDSPGEDSVKQSPWTPVGESGSTAGSPQYPDPGFTCIHGNVKSHYNVIQLIISLIYITAVKQCGDRAIIIILFIYYGYYYYYV